MAEEFKYDPEAEENKRRVLRLPFALCKRHGIAIQDWWSPRDAWEALRNNGVVQDPSEEMKNYYRDIKKKQSKEWRKSLAGQMSKERSRAKKIQKADPDHSPENITSHVAGTVANVPKGTPMAFEQADSGNVNPFFDKKITGTNVGYIGYHTNCQTCVATFLARKQGYDVRALPNLDNEAINRLSHNITLAYVNDQGEHPSKEGVQNRRMLQQIGRMLPPDEDILVDWKWRGRNSGHVVIGTKNERGEFILYDPQTDTKYSEKEMASLLHRSENINITRTKEYRLDEQFCDKILKRR